jgi:hypothetical protein
MNTTTSQLALHKDKRLLPVKLTVRRVSGIGEDTLCMGMMEVRCALDGQSLTVRLSDCPTVSPSSIHILFGWLYLTTTARSALAVLHAHVQPIETCETTASVWLRMNGTVILASPRFNDCFGFKTKEVDGTPFLTLAVSNGKKLQE